MSDLQAIADRVEIEALRGELTDAGMMRDFDRFASLFTQVQDGMFFQAAVVALSSRAEAAIGRCVAAISSATSEGTSAANTSRNLSCLMYRSTPGSPPLMGRGTGSRAGPSSPPGTWRPARRCSRPAPG